MSTTYIPDPNHPSFCQVCGRAVASEADRAEGRAFHCGLCNEVRLASPASTGGFGAQGAPDPAGPSAGIPGAGMPGAGPGVGGAIPPFNPADNPFAPSSAAAGAPNPGLAALLGLIPGVGAMYNGQYAKGVVHLIVFAVLVNLADSHDIFGLFVAGWIFYQAIEAYHTARARRDGTPLPNPFGLNDIGERFGFGKAWPAASAPPVPPNPAATPTGGSPVQGAAGAPYQAPTPVANWGAPWDSYSAVPPPPPVYPPYTPYTQAGYPPPPPPPPFGATEYPPYDPVRSGFGVPPVVPRNRFPAGAIWLIALGTLFLLNTSGIFHGFPSRIFLPAFFLGMGVWIFIRKMTDTGYGLSDDGTPAYRIRLFRATRSAVWLILLGVIFFLADFHILPWSRSWPLFLILAGVMAFLERSVYGSAAATPYPYGGPAAPFTAPATEATPGTTTTNSAVSSEPSAPNQESR